MQVFESAGDEPIRLIDMGEGYGMLSQVNELGQWERVGTNAQRLRAMADYLERHAKNTDRGSQAA